jgi:hypothetical protein
MRNIRSDFRPLQQQLSGITEFRQQDETWCLAGKDYELLHLGFTEYLIAVQSYSDALVSVSQVLN